MSQGRARAQRAADASLRKAPLSPRAIELVENVRRERNEKLAAARGAAIRAVREIEAQFHADRIRFDREMRETIDTIERGDRAGVLLGFRVDETVEEVAS